MVVFIVTCLMVILSLSRTLSEEIPEFQYPCYVDVCTFPSQYCNSDRYERRCSSCSRDICKKSNVPLACRYICMKHNELTTLKPTTVTTPHPKSESAAQGNVDSLHLIMSYSAVTTTLLVVLLLSFVAYYIHGKKVKKEKRAKELSQVSQYRTSNRTNQGEVVFQEIPSEQQRYCRNCGHTPRPETEGPPSYRTCADQGHGMPTRSNTPSDPSPSGSTDSVPSSSTKTVMVKPLPSKPLTKVNNSAVACKINRNKRSVETCDSGTQALEMESLIDSHEQVNSEETIRKESNS